MRFHHSLQNVVQMQCTTFYNGSTMSNGGVGMAYTTQQAVDTLNGYLGISEEEKNTLMIPKIEALY